MDATILRSLLLVTIAVIMVLLIRRPLRQSIGAGPAFTLWLLPPLLAMLPWLPALPAQWMVLPTIHVLAGDTAQTVASARVAAAGSWLGPLWLAGTALGLLRLIAHYTNLYRHSQPVPASWTAVLRDEMRGFDPRRVRLHPAGPAVLCAPRSLLLLPPDFTQRFHATQRRLILRHELAHLRRGDVLWSLLAELAAALLWFHPLVWLALSRFRLDQELACDERVLRRSPQDEASYAHILMHSIGSSPLPALIPWLAEPQLKERLIMIQRHRPGALRRRIGYLGLAALMAGSVLVAQARPGLVADQPAKPDVTHNALMSPAYPVSAVKNHEEGTVVLLVQIHADGTVGTISYDPESSTTTSADLIASASNRARQWRFNPQTRDGKPVDGYARVPVKFSLTPLPGEVSRDEIEKWPSKYRKVN